MNANGSHEAGVTTRRGARRRPSLILSLFAALLVSGTPAPAEKESSYTTDEDYLPLGTEQDEKEKEANSAFLKDDSLVKNAIIKGIKIVKGESRVVFSMESSGPAGIAGKDLKFEAVAVNFPPRVILRMYGVKSPESVFRFFKNLDVIGIVSNPFVQEYLSEYVIFFKDWVSVSCAYSREETRLVLGYEFKNPDFRKGYGVRIADTKIDPLIQTVAIRNELKRNKLQSYLLIASDFETVVLESPFYRAKEEAVAYMDSLEKVGYKGKLAIRNYADFPEPLRIDVVSEVVVTGEDTVNLKNLVYTELTPQNLHPLSYSDIYTITKDLFSAQVQNNDNAMAEYYYKLSEIYRGYASDDEAVRRFAKKVTVKVLEIIVFKFPSSEKADEALWSMANIIKEHGVKDQLSEEQCYRKIVDEYPNSAFRAEAQKRLAFLKRQSGPPPDNKGGKRM
jgi:hypothetical protein